MSSKSSLSYANWSTKPLNSTIRMAKVFHQPLLIEIWPTDYPPNKTLQVIRRPSGHLAFSPRAVHARLQSRLAWRAIVLKRSAKVAPAMGGWVGFNRNAGTDALAASVQIHMQNNASPVSHH
jgi:hypothetical protein